MPPESSKPKDADRVAIIGAVKTYLGFFVLIVLVVEAVLGTLALKSEGPNQLVALYSMLFVIVLLIAVVSLFAYLKPDALLRTVTSHQAVDAQPFHDFCHRISGHWWERIKPNEPSSISFVEIRPDPATNTIKMKGNGYNKNGEFVSIWESVASCINPSERKVFYYWKGWHPARPNEPYEGFGEISFHDTSDRIDSAVGLFSDTNLTDIQSTTKKSIDLRRCDETDVQVMQNGTNDKAIADMIRKRLD